MDRLDSTISRLIVTGEDQDHQGAGIHAEAARGAAVVGTAVVPWGPINLAHCSLRLRGQHLRLARYTLFMAARSALPARILTSSCPPGQLHSQLNYKYIE